MKLYKHINPIILTAIITSLCFTQIDFNPPTLDFGPVTVDETLTEEVEITSDLAQTITLSGLDAPFSVDQSELEFEAGQILTLVFTFTPTANGDYSAVLNATGSVWGDVTYNIIGEGVAVEIDVSPMYLDFGEIALYSTGTETITITNNGTGTLAVSNILSSDSQFEPDTGVLNLGTGVSATVDIIYTPTINGERIATLSIFNNDPSDQVVYVSMTGVGISNVAGEATGTWYAANSPYHITNDVTVPDGGTLTIEPGVEVVFDGDYMFLINGTLIAEGDDNDYIHIHSAGDEQFGTLKFDNADNPIDLKNLKIENIGGNHSLMQFYDNFDDGYWSDYWSEDGSGGTVGISGTYYSAPHSFRVYAVDYDKNVYTGNYIVYGKAFVSFWYKITTSDNGCDFRFYWKKNNGGWLELFNTNDGDENDWIYYENDFSGSVETGDQVEFRIFSNVYSTSGGWDKLDLYIDEFKFETNAAVSIYNTPLTMENCLVINNLSSGIYSNSTLSLIYTTIAFNDGIGIELVGNNFSTISKSIVWHNDNQNHEQISLTDGIVVSNYTGDGILSTTFSDIQGFTSYGTTGTGEYVWGAGMIESDPVFESDNSVLSENSPCVDAAAPWEQDAYMPPGLGIITADMGAFGGPNNGAWDDAQAIPDGDPAIDNIVDIPEDQGGFVGLQYSASIFDYFHTAYDITHYSFWRLLDFGDREEVEAEPTPTGVIWNRDDEYWEHVGEMPAQGFQDYGFTAPTLADSTESFPYESTFLVVAHTPDDDVFFGSESASGSSVDNLAPEVPVLLSGEFNDGQISLLWSGPVDDDFANFNIYRNGELYSTALDSEFVDLEVPNIPEVYYSISSMDHSDNESELSPELMVQAMIMGDMNGDFTLNVLDLVLMMEFILQIGDIENFTQADLNEDGVVDVLDIVILVNIILDNNDMNRVSTEAKVYQSSKGLKHSSSGDIAYHITLKHAEGFSLTLTEDAFASSVNTIGTLTEMIIINPETDILFTTDDYFSITEIKAASGSSYINVDIINLPESFSLSQAYPNPFNPVTSFSYGLPSEANLSIQVYDIQGKLIETLYDGLQSAGFHQLSWNADNLASGLYIIRVVGKSDAEIYSSQQKLMLLK